jgi:hypothetical protein
LIVLITEWFNIGEYMNVETIVLALIGLAGSGAAGIFIDRWFGRRKSLADANKIQADANKVKAETDNQIVETVEDALALQRLTYEQSISMLEVQVKELKRNREDDLREIRKLNEMIGSLRKSGEEQSDTIMRLYDEVSLWRARG